MPKGLKTINSLTTSQMVINQMKIGLMAVGKMTGVLVTDNTLSYFAPP
jgi:hypothetical protein